MTSPKPKGTREHENINRVATVISNLLNEEIEYALKNLRNFEKNKRQGQKKKKWTKLEASHELGRWLKSERRSNKKIKLVFNI